LPKIVATQPAAAFAVWRTSSNGRKSSGRSAELLTPGPIRAGTRLRQDRIVFCREATQDLEVETIDRPRRLRLLVEHPDLNYELDHLVDAIYSDGCRLMLIFRSRPKTAPGRILQPLMTPSMEISLRDELEQDLSDLAAAFSRRD
jgi:hypothetical protein